MRKVIVIIALCGLVLLAFAATASAKEKALPFQGYLIGQVWFTPDAASPSPLDLWSDSSGAGDVSHLGATVMSGRHPTPTGDVISDGNMRLVAASGDEVWMTYSGSAPFPVLGVPSTIVAHTTFVITGGTGRFASASGGGEMIGYVEFPGQLGPGPWPVVWTWRATISY
jgi:hypothetical protein